MAVPGGTFQQHTVIGDREDLSDVIYDISPMDTPFMSNIKRGSASRTFTEWQTDGLAAHSATNAQIEGDDANVSTAVPTVRLGNYTQISTKVPRVSGTLRSIDTAGRSDELSYQIAKRGRELKRDIEAALTSNAAASAGGAGTARTLAGIGTWLWDNQTKTGTSVAATTVTVTSGAPTTAPTAGTAGNLTEADVKSTIQNCWTDGGDVGVMMMGAFNKATASSAFTGIGTQYRDVQPSEVGPGTIVGAADLYVSDFGTHQLIANRFQPAGDAYLLDLEYWEVAYLRPIQQEDLSKTGDSDRRLLVAEYTLCAKEPKANGKVYTLTTS